MDRNAKIAIVGGSLVGPATALMLQRRGISATVYDAIAPTVSQAGGVIGLNHASLDALEELGITQEEIVPFNSERVLSIQMRTERRIETYYAGRNTTWTLLHQALSSRLDNLVQGKRVVGIDTTPQGAQLAFADGSHADCDLVIFADGRKSEGRKLLDPTRKLEYAGYVANRGVWLGDVGDMRGIRDFVRYEAMGTQFNLFPVLNADGSICMDWTFYLSAEASQFATLFGGKPTTRTFVLDSQIGNAARSWVDSGAQQMLGPVADVVRNTTTRAAAPIVDIAPPSRLHWLDQGIPAVLLGDAAAPVRPHTASGANLGLVQAHTLAGVLGQVINHSANLQSALSAWQDWHIPQITATLQKGRTMAKMIGLG